MTSGHDRPSGLLAPPSGFDVLSDMLHNVRLTGAMLFLVEAAAPWASWAPQAETFRSVVLPRAQHIISFHIVTEGSCWGGLVDAASQRLNAGDVLVVAHGDAYFLAHTASAERTYGEEVALSFFRDMVEGKLPPLVSEGGNGPDKCQFICGFLGCDVRPFNPILSALPRVVRVGPAKAGGTDPLVAFALRELRTDRAGSKVVKLRTAELLFVDVMRRYLENLPSSDGGWLAGLRDPLVARALSLLHEAPAHNWTLERLAAQAVTSRSVLAERFAGLIGQTPIHYLRELRMQLACRLLLEDGSKVVAVAAATGFESEAAFSRAFKRCVGVSPNEWRQRRT